MFENKREAEEYAKNLRYEGKTAEIRKIGNKYAVAIVKYTACPFCGEGDFDRPGLKYHLKHYCTQYEDTEEL